MSIDKDGNKKPGVPKGTKRPVKDWTRYSRRIKSEDPRKLKYTDGTKIWYVNKNEFPYRPWHHLMIEYLANPVDGRNIKQFMEDVKKPRSNYDRMLKLHRETIYKLVDATRRHYMSDLRMKTFKALGGRLSQSDKAIQMSLEMTGDYIPRSEQRVEYDTKEAKQERVRELLARFGNKRKNNPNETNDNL